MARKCDSAKYRKRRARELVNRKEREAKQRARDYKAHLAREEWRKRRQWEWDHDERRLLMMRVIKILRRRLESSPGYVAMEIIRIWGGGRHPLRFSPEVLISEELMEERSNE